MGHGLFGEDFPYERYSRARFEGVAAAEAILLGEINRLTATADTVVLYQLRYELISLYVNQRKKELLTLWRRLPAEDED